MIVKMNKRERKGVNIFIELSDFISNTILVTEAFVGLVIVYISFFVVEKSFDF